MFDAFQKEQKAIIDEQLKSLVKYHDTYKAISDADALEYVNSLLERDQKIHDLRVKYLAKFQTVVPTGSPHASSSSTAGSAWSARSRSHRRFRSFPEVAQCRRRQIGPSPAQRPRGRAEPDFASLDTGQGVGGARRAR